MCELGKKNQDLCIHTYIYYNYLQGCPDLPQPSGIQLSCQNTNILKWQSSHQKATWGNLSHFQLVIKKLRSAPWAKKKYSAKKKEQDIRTSYLTWVKNWVAFSWLLETIVRVISSFWFIPLFCLHCWGLLCCNKLVGHVLRFFCTSWSILPVAK